MRRTALALVWVLLALTACTTGQQPAPHPFDVPWEDRSAFRAGLIESERSVLNQLAGATVYHMDLEIADDLTSLSGREQVRYTNREATSLDQVCFRLYPNVNGGEISVTAIEADGRTVQPSYHAQRSALCAELDSALAQQASVVLELGFEVKLPTDMGGNYGLFGYFEDVLVLDTFYPAIPVYDERGWQIETPARNGDLTAYDASFYLVRVSAPKRLTWVASGSEIGRETRGRRQVVTLAAGPARDFYLAASEQFVRESVQVGETMVHSYAFRNRREAAKQALKHAEAALESFGARMGSYPYTEMDLASTPMSALGIEYPGTMGLSLRLYDLQAEVLGLPAPVLLESVVAHEIGHQWFYNMVGNDQQAEPWLDEALTQYITGLYYADTYGDQAAEGYRGSWYDRWGQVEQAEIPIGKPAGAYSADEYSPIVYGRGPVFVMAMAQEMGQPAFDRFLHDYVQTTKWQIATPERFRAMAETHCACDLGPLFEQWVYEPAP